MATVKPHITIERIRGEWTPVQYALTRQGQLQVTQTNLGDANRDNAVRLAKIWARQINVPYKDPA